MCSSDLIGSVQAGFLFHAGAHGLVVDIVVQRARRAHLANRHPVARCDRSGLGVFCAVPDRDGCL